ncbi:MAG: exodeoxyribonuclease VII small subunit [Clostridia bacterium]|nr:exodeoxyribonuclease VII small subunit [Clostridia bacterium]
MENGIQFEDKLKELELIAHKLESADVSLEESIKLFEKGMQISKECSDALNDAKQKITLLTEELK